MYFAEEDLNEKDRVACLPSMTVYLVCETAKGVVGISTYMYATVSNMELAVVHCCYLQYNPFFRRIQLV